MGRMRAMRRMNTRIGDGQTANMTFTNCETEFFMKLVLKCGEVLVIEVFTPIPTRFFNFWILKIVVLEFVRVWILKMRQHEI